MKEAIVHLRKADPVMRAIIDQVGAYQIQFRDPDFETLVKSIVYQQLSGRVAGVIFGRVTDAAGGRLTPEGILKLRPVRMRTLGLSGQKTAYIRDLARHTRDGRLAFEELARLPDGWRQVFIDGLARLIRKIKPHRPTSLHGSLRSVPHHRGPTQASLCAGQSPGARRRARSA